MTYTAKDMWTDEDDQLFLKYCEDPLIRLYHSMSRDVSNRPHELLKVRIGDIIEYRIYEVLMERNMPNSRLGPVVRLSNVKSSYIIRIRVTLNTCKDITQQNQIQIRFCSKEEILDLFILILQSSHPH